MTRKREEVGVGSLELCWSWARENGRSSSGREKLERKGRERRVKILVATSTGTIDPVFKFPNLQFYPLIFGILILAPNQSFKISN